VAQVGATSAPAARHPITFSEDVMIRRHDHRKRAALAVAGQMHLRAQPSPAAPECLVLGVRYPLFASSPPGLRRAPAGC
jgi:hypothetical protein